MSLSIKAVELQTKVAEFFKQSPSQVDLVIGTRKLLQTDDLASLGCREAMVLDMVMNSPARCEVVPHRFDNIYEVKGTCYQGERMVTRSLTPGTSVLLEDRVVAEAEEDVEYRVWSPYSCALIAAIVCGIGSFPIRPGTTVLFTDVAPLLEPTVSYVSDIVGATGRVLIVGGFNSIAEWAALRSNIVQLDAGALEGPLPAGELVDVVVNGTTVPEGEVAMHKEWIKPGGWAVHVIDASVSMGSERAPYHVFNDVVLALRSAGMRPREQITLDPYHRDAAVIVSQLRPKAVR